MTHLVSNDQPRVTYPTAVVMARRPVTKVELTREESKESKKQRKQQEVEAETEELRKAKHARDLLIWQTIQLQQNR